MNIQKCCRSLVSDIDVENSADSISRKLFRNLCQEMM